MPSNMNVTANKLTLTAALAGATSYKWLDCGDAMKPVAGQTAQTFTAPKNGNYAVVIDLNGCADTSTCVVANNGIGIDKISSAEVKFFPNPSSKEVSIDFGVAITGKVEIFNTTGQVVRSTEVVAKKQELVDLSALENGIYFIQITSDEVNMTGKLIKE